MSRQARALATLAVMMSALFTGFVRAQGYELVGSPAEADLLFEIRLTVIPDRDANRAVAVFRLEIRDPKMNALLWAYNEYVEWAILESNRNKNFDQALARMVRDVAGLRARAAARTAQVKPQL